MGSVADKAKLAPGQKIVAVNGTVYSSDAMTEAVNAAKTGKEPIHLLIQSESFIKPVEIDYHDGMRYPAMVRVEGTKDYLDEITTPLSKSPNPPAATPAAAATK
jgi:C-terminal processing protease CtpA/Prc